MNVRADISPSDVDAALQAVLQSDTFARSGRARDLLAYLVSQEQQGNGTRLKAFTIAQDVFDRDDSFDPQSDAIVRVQAGRLRDLLGDYYAEEGRGDAVVIRVPVGNYVPVYEDNPASGSPREAAASLMSSQAGPVADGGHAVNISPDIPVSPFIVRNIRRFWVVLAAILLLTLVILSLTWMQFRAVTGSQIDERPAPQTLAQVSTGAFRLPSLSVVEPGSGSSQTPSPAILALRRDISRFSLVRLAADSEVPVAPDFRMTTSPLDDSTLGVEVTNTSDGAVVWAGVIEGSHDDAALTANADTLTLLLAADGLLYSDLAERTSMSVLMQCLRRTQSYFRALTPEAFFAALGCHDSLIQSIGAHPLVRADLASLIVDGFARGFELDGRTVDTALDLARGSVEAWPSSAYARRALSVALFADGQTEAALDEMATAYELNPANLNIGAAYGFALVQAQQFEKAARVLLSVTSASNSPLPWWNQMLFLSAVALGNDALAIRAAQQLTSYEQPFELAMRLAGAQLAGDADQVQNIVSRLQNNPGLRLEDPARRFAETIPQVEAERLAAILLDADY